MLAAVQQVINSFYTIWCSTVETSLSFVQRTQKLVDYQDLTYVFLRLCKIHEHAGFVQSSSKRYYTRYARRSGLVLKVGVSYGW